MNTDHKEVDGNLKEIGGSEMQLCPADRDDLKTIYQSLQIHIITTNGQEKEYRKRGVKITNNRVLYLRCGVNDVGKAQSGLNGDQLPPHFNSGKYKLTHQSQSYTGEDFSYHHGYQKE